MRQPPDITAIIGEHGIAELRPHSGAADTFLAKHFQRLDPRGDRDVTSDEMAALTRLATASGLAVRYVR